MIEQKKIQILTENKELIEVPYGSVLREVLIASDKSPHQDHFVYLNCHGNGICGSCVVMIKELEGWEERRSCQHRCYQNLEIKRLSK